MRRRGLLGALLAMMSAGCVGTIEEVIGERNETDDSLAFRDQTDEVNLDYAYRTGRGSSVEKISNAGVYISDFNNDGWDDLLAIGGNEPILFENQEGSFSPSDAIPPLDVEPYAALFFDANNSGWEDLLLLCRNDEMRFLANNEGTFEVQEVGLSVPLTDPIGAGAADATGNGFPDVFIVQNGDWNRQLPAGYRTYLTEQDDNGAPNRLFRNEGGSFTEMTNEAGIEGDHWSLAMSFVDLTDNGWPDIHIANDFARDVLYQNLGDGQFERRTLGEHTDRNGMSSAIADFSGDGTFDIFVTNIYYPSEIRETLGGTLSNRSIGNNLLQNQGDGTFEDIADAVGVRKGGWGWAAVVADFNNNGHLDLFHATSRDTLYDWRVLSPDEVEEMHETYSFYLHPALWEGGSDGFTPRSANAVGIPEMNSRGVGEMDVNNTGSVDLVVADASGPYHVLANESHGGRALQLTLKPANEMTALGTKVRVTMTDQTHIQAADSNTDFFSQGSRRLHFGVGNDEEVDIEITWPSSEVQNHDAIETDQHLTISPEGIESSQSFF